MSVSSCGPALSAKERLIIALDVATAADARKLVTLFGEEACFYKIGLQLFTAAGPDFVREIAGQGKRIFLDLKLHDIPNTVAAAVKSISGLGVELLTVHASGGPQMLAAAVAAAAEGRPDAQTALKILAVTLLTSMSEADLKQTGIPATVADHVLRMADLAAAAGCGGVVCSPQEVSQVRKRLREEMVIVAPGVRPAGGAQADHSRVASPGEAIRAGATQLVVGRPITAASDPRQALRAVLKEMEAALAGK